MADGDVNVKIKLGSDLSGGVQSREELKKIRAEANKTGNDTAKSAAKAAHGMQGLEKSVGLVRKVLSGFGVGALFLSAVAGVEKIIESFGRAEQKAKDMQKAAAEKAFAKSISDLADSYAKLNAQLSAAEQKENNVLEIIDAEVKARRDLQEAKISAAEQDELATVDPNAKDAAEQRAIIQAKYQHMRDTNAASDKVEDLVLQRQKYDTQAKADDKAAESKENEASDLERKARLVKSKAEGEGIAAVAPNEKDKSGIARYFLEGFREIFTLDWGRVGSWKTEAGDAERDKHKANQEALEKQAEELQKQADAARKDAEAKRESASQNRRRMEAMNGSVEAAQINEDTQQLKSSSTEADARRSLEKRREEIRREEDDERRKKDEEAAKKAREEEEVAKARALLASAPARVESLQRQISANDQGIVSTSFNVATGGTSANAGGEAVAALRQQNAQLNSLLSTLLKEIEQSKRVIERANERTRNSKGVDSEEGR